MSIRFGWYPGRVAWIHFGVNVGWVPLAPHEPYYCHRHWGPRTIVVKDVHVTKVHVDQYVHVDHAVVVKSHDFYRADNYKNFRVGDVDRKTIVTRYQPAPVIDQKIVPEKGRERYSFSPVRTEGRQESVSKGGGPDRPSAAKEERVRSQTTAGGVPTPSRMEKKEPFKGDQPGKSKIEPQIKPQVQQGRVEDRARSDAAKREVPSSERRPVDDQGASGTKRDRSGTPEIQRPSAGPTEDRTKSGGGEREIPRHGKPEREFKGTVKEASPGNAPKNEISSPEKAETESRAGSEDKRGRPSRAPNQDRQMEPEKKQQQQRGARGRE